MADIVGLGTVGIDVLVRVDKLPGPDGFAVVTDRIQLPGGSGTNVISQAAKLGANCSYICQVGDDQLGTEIVDSLAASNVDTAPIRVMPGGKSLSTTVVVDADGERFILLDMGDAFMSLSPEYVDTDAIEHASALYTDLLPGEAAMRGIETATAAGVPVVLGLEVGLGTMNGLGVSRETILDAVRLADFVFPCQHMARDLSGQATAFEALPYFSDLCAGTVIVTMGSEGAAALQKGGDIIRVSGLPIDPVDTTGAGDAFAGAFLTSFFVDHLPTKTSLMNANAAAAFSCTGLGARSGPDQVQLSEFISSSTKE